jgi:Zn/Cd-binding protein ZinT
VPRFFDLLNEGQKEKLVQYKSFKSGDFLIVRVKEFYQKSNILLTTDINNVNPLKQRPIIVIRGNNGTISFIATSTNILFKHKRPKINLSNCFFRKRTKEECLGLDIKDEVFLFTKDGKRFKFYINPQVLIDLYKEGNLIECGNCSMIIPLIEKLIGGAG